MNRKLHEFSALVEFLHCCYAFSPFSLVIMTSTLNEFVLTILKSATVDVLNSYSQSNFSIVGLDPSSRPDYSRVAYISPLPWRWLQ